MTLTLATHAIAALFGGGLVFIYLHKHQTKAIAAANNLAVAVSDAKTVLAAAKSKV